MTIQEFLWYLFCFILISMMIIVIVVFSLEGYNEFHRYNTYKNFCKDKSFCYCDYGSCEFRTSFSQSCINNNCSSYEALTETKELCEIVKQLDDKKVQFKLGCEYIVNSKGVERNLLI